MQSRGVVKNSNSWVPKFCYYQFVVLGCQIRRYFTYTDPYFLQNPWVPFHNFQKSVGSMEPTEPMLTTPLYSYDLNSMPGTFSFFL